MSDTEDLDNRELNGVDGTIVSVKDLIIGKIVLELDNKPIKHSVEFNDFAIVLGAVCCPEIDAFSWVEVHSQDVDSVIFHLDMNLCPSVFVLVNLRDRFLQEFRQLIGQTKDCDSMMFFNLSNIKDPETLSNLERRLTTMSLNCAISVEKLRVKKDILGTYHSRLRPRNYALNMGTESAPLDIKTEMTTFSAHGKSEGVDTQVKTEVIPKVEKEEEEDDCVVISDDDDGGTGKERRPSAPSPADPPNAKRLKTEPTDNESARTSPVIALDDDSPVATPANTVDVPSMGATTATSERTSDGVVTPQSTNPPNESSMSLPPTPPSTTASAPANNESALATPPNGDGGRTDAQGSRGHNNNDDTNNKEVFNSCPLPQQREDIPKEVLDRTNPVQQKLIESIVVLWNAKLPRMPVFDNSQYFANWEQLARNYQKVVDLKRRELVTIKAELETALRDAAHGSQERDEIDVAFSFLELLISGLSYCRKLVTVDLEKTSNARKANGLVTPPRQPSQFSPNSLPIWEQPPQLQPNSVMSVSQTVPPPAQQQQQQRLSIPHTQQPPSVQIHHRPSPPNLGPPQMVFGNQPPASATTGHPEGIPNIHHPPGATNTHHQNSQYLLGAQHAQNVQTALNSNPSGPSFFQQLPGALHSANSQGIAPSQLPQGINNAQHPLGTSNLQQFQGISNLQRPHGTSNLQHPQGTSNWQHPQQTSNLQRPQQTSNLQHSQGNSSLQHQGTSNLEHPQGTSNLQHPQGTSNLQHHQGNSNLLQPRGTHNLPQPQGTHNLPQPQGTNLPHSQGNFNPHHPQGISNVRPPQGISNTPQYASNNQVPPGSAHSQLPSHIGTSIGVNPQRPPTVVNSAAGSIQSKNSGRGRHPGSKNRHPRPSKQSAAPPPPQQTSTPNAQMRFHASLNVQSQFNVPTSSGPSNVPLNPGINNGSAQPSQNAVPNTPVVESVSSLSGGQQMHNGQSSQHGPRVQTFPPYTSSRVARMETNNKTQTSRSGLATAVLSNNFPS